MATELRDSSQSGTERLVKAVHQQTEWLLMKFQHALERNKAIYMESNMESTLSHKRAKRVSVVLYLMAVTFFAVSIGIHYTFVWQPCPKNFFYKSQRLCLQGCDNKDYKWNETWWHKTASGNYCGNKKINCNTTDVIERNQLNISKSTTFSSSRLTTSRDGSK